MKSLILRSMRIFFGYLGVTCFLFWPALSGQILAQRDLIAISYPFRWLAMRIWMMGEIPLWNSAAACGSPLLADVVAGAFDPFSVIFLLPFDIFSNGTIYIWLKYLLAGLAMHRYLRLTGLTQLSSFLGGCSYILSGFSIGSWLTLAWVAALMYLPLALAASRTCEKAGIMGLTAGSIFSLSFFSGAIEPTAFMIVLWLIIEKPRFSAATIAILSFVAFSILQILPTYEAFALSDRSGGLRASEVLDYSVSPFQLIGLAMPVTFVPEGGGMSYPNLFRFEVPIFLGTYVGAALLPIALLGADRRTASVLAVALFFALGRYAPGIEDLLVAYPSLGVVRYPVKFLWFLPPVLALWTARGIEKTPSTKLPLAAATAFSIIVIFFLVGTIFPDPLLPDKTANEIWLAHADMILHAARHVLVFFSVAVILAANGKKFLLVCIIVIDLLIAGTRVIFFHPSLDHPPPLRSEISASWPRVISTYTVPFPDYHPDGTQAPNTRHVYAVMRMNSGIPWMVRHVGEYGSFHYRHFRAWWRELMSDQSNPLSLFSAAGITHYICDTPLAAGAKEEGWLQKGRNRNLILFENPVRMSEVRFYPDNSPLDVRNRGIEIPDFRHALNGTLEVDFLAPSPGWLNRAEHWYPGWKVTVNGLEGDAISAPEFFGQMARIENAGRVSAVFRYDPPLFQIGLFSSCAAAILSGTFLLVARPKP